MSEWVSTQDQFPVDRQEVLVSLRTEPDLLDIARWREEVGTWSLIRGASTPLHRWAVGHWMTLPEPPED